MTDALSHFLDLALRGKQRGCSGGCKRARVIARAVVDCVPGLDGLARDGLREFINLTSNAPGTARDLLYGDSTDDC
jgi:hypothetical protein